MIHTSSRNLGEVFHLDHLSNQDSSDFFESVDDSNTNDTRSNYNDQRNMNPATSLSQSRSNYTSSNFTSSNDDDEAIRVTNRSIADTTFTDDSYGDMFPVAENAMYPSSRALVIPERIAEDDDGRGRRPSQNRRRSHQTVKNVMESVGEDHSDNHNDDDDDDDHHESVTFHEDDIDDDVGRRPSSSGDLERHPDSAFFPSSVTKRFSSNGEINRRLSNDGSVDRPSSRRSSNDGRPPSRRSSNDGGPPARRSSNDGGPPARRSSNDGGPLARRSSNDGRPPSRRSSNDSVPLARRSSNEDSLLDSDIDRRRNSRRFSNGSRRSATKKESFKKGKRRVNFNAREDGDDDEYDSDDEDDLDEEFGDDAGSTSSRLDVKGELDFERDPIDSMTYGRQWALRLLHKKWYNPLAGAQGKVKLESKLNVFFTQMDLPSLSKGWAYFEHVVLSRYVVLEHNVDWTKMTMWERFKFSFKNYDEELERAQPGVKKHQTRLYDPISTPHIQLGDFGMGFGLYFSTLRAIGYLSLLSALMSLYSFYYYASDKYYFHHLSNPLLRGSAICTKQEFVACIDCRCDDRNQVDDTQAWWRAPERCKTPVRSWRDDLFWYNETFFPDFDSPLPTLEDDLIPFASLTFALKNRCLEEPGILLKLGLNNFGLMIFLFLSMFALGTYLEDQAVKFDEDEQTAQDYSIIISNPPPKATDPEIWKRYFEENFDGVKVAAITCAVNNDLLVKALVARRETLRKLELCLDKGTPMDIDHLALMAAKQVNGYSLIHRIIRLFIPSVPELLSELVSLNTRIKGLAQLSYPCTNVYVTFETERDQRYVMSKLSVGTSHVWRNNHNALSDKKYVFQGRHVLKAEEAVEPNTVRWQDLNVGYTHRMQQIVVANIFTWAAIFVCGVIVTLADTYTLGAAFSISGE
jgi:hypothetical protein